jgi:ParB/RepB/Spo0J family partition protein
MSVATKSLKLGTGKTVLEIHIVTGKSARANKHGDDPANEVLQQAGFVERKYAGGRTTGRTPGGETSYFVEIEGKPSKGKAFKIVRQQGGKFDEIDSGTLSRVEPISGGHNEVDIEASGNRLLNWGFVCETSQAKIGDVTAAPPPKPLPPEEDEVPEPPPRPRTSLRPSTTVLTAPRRSTPVLPLVNGNGAPKASPVVVSKPAPVVPAPHVRIITPVEPPSVNGKHANGDHLKDKSDEKVIYIRVDECVVFQPGDGFSGQPRKTFEESDIHELGASIREDGQQTPILVMAITHISGKKWEIIAGERRWRAHQYIGFGFIKAIQKFPKNKKEQHKLALLENLHRKPPSTIEFSNALQEQIRAGETQQSLALSFGIPLQEIRHILSLQLLAPELRELVSVKMAEEARLRPAESRELCKITHDTQKKVLDDARALGGPRRLLATKIRILGKPYLVRVTGRGNRQDEPGVVARTLRRLLHSLEKPLLELDAKTPEEYGNYASVLGEHNVGEDLKLVDRLLESLWKNREQIVQAQSSRAAVKPVIVVTPS